MKTAPLSFFIDTSSDKGIMALFKGETFMGSLTFKSADSAMPFIEKMFKELSVLPNQIELIGVGMGPGSFTGVRVGVMIARSLAFSLNVPIIGLSSLSLFSSELPVVVDARIGGLWAQFPNQSPCILSVAEGVALLKNYPTIVTPDNRRLESRLIDGGYTGSVVEKNPDPVQIARQLSQVYRSLSCGYTDILYLRATQAEIEKKLS